MGATQEPHEHQRRTHHIIKNHQDHQQKRHTQLHEHHQKENTNTHTHNPMNTNTTNTTYKQTPHTTNTNRQRNAQRQRRATRARAHGPWHIPCLSSRSHQANRPGVPQTARHFERSGLALLKVTALCLAHVTECQWSTVCCVCCVFCVVLCGVVFCCVCWWMYTVVCKGMLYKKKAMLRITWPPTFKNTHFQVFRKNVEPLLENRVLHKPLAKAQNNSNEPLVLLHRGS